MLEFSNWQLYRKLEEKQFVLSIYYVSILKEESDD